MCPAQLKGVVQALAFSDEVRSLWQIWLVEVKLLVLLLLITSHR